MKRALLLSLLCWAALLPAFGSGIIIIHDDHFWRHPPHHPHPPIRPPIPPPRPKPTPQKALEVVLNQVQANIRNQRAETHVVQEFYNPNHRQVEGTFLFPLPKGAHLDKFTMMINGKPVEAELLAGDKARNIYEEIVRKLKDPALLEYAGRDLFRMRIFPIAAKGKQRITLDYTQILPVDNGVMHYVYPLTTDKMRHTPAGNLSLKVDIDSKEPLRAIYSPSHTIDVNRKDDHHAVVGHESSGLSAESDFQLYVTKDPAEVGLTLLTHRADGGDGYFLLLATPQFEQDGAPVMPKDVLFVLDTSGSMAGKKLDQAKKALNFCVANLNEGDRFEILRFSTEVEPLFESLAAANEQNRDRARQFVAKLKPIGGTAIDSALQRALTLRDKESERPYLVIFLTDGRPTVGKTDVNQIVKGVAKHSEVLTRIFCFGIGTDINTHLLDRITGETRAASQYVLPEEDIEIKVSSFFTKIKEPVLANTKLVFPDNIRVTRLHPKTLPDLFKGEQLLVTGRYSGDGEGLITIKGLFGGKDREIVHEAAFRKRNDSHDFIPRLWATRRVGFLLDQIRLNGETKELRDEVTQLARRHGIVTPYTAYLIIEDDKNRGLTQRDQLLPQDFYAEELNRRLSTRYQEFQMNTTGDAAVSGARALSVLKDAQTASKALARGNQEAERGAFGGGLFAPAPDSGATQPSRPGTGVPTTTQPVSNQTTATRFIAGRTFFYKSGKWMDSRISENPSLKRVKVTFGSEAYFDLLKKHPEAARWLSLGRHVEFILDQVLYEIVTE